jgi:hypothetical protein
MLLPLVTGLFLWLKADAVTGLDAGSPVVKWVDSSSSHMDATMDQKAMLPKYQPNVINGKPVLRFNEGQVLGTAPMQLLQNGNDSLTLLMVFRTKTIDRMSYLIHKPGTGTSGIFDVGIDAGPQSTGNIGLEQFGKNGVVSEAHALVPNDFYIFTLAIAGEGQSPSNISMTLNAAPIASSKYGSGWFDSGNYPLNVSSFEIGAQKDPMTGNYQNFFSGDIAEIMVFSRILPPQELAHTGCYLKRKYNIAEAEHWCAKD